MISLWQPCHNWIVHIEFKVYIHIVGSTSPNYSTITIYLQILSYKISFTEDKSLWQFQITKFTQKGDRHSEFLKLLSSVTHYDVITLAAWSQLNRVYCVQGIYVFWWFNFTQLYHNHYLLSLSYIWYFIQWGYKSLTISDT